MKCDKVPSEQEYDAAFAGRNSKVVNDKLKTITVGVAGLGGLGSNVAMMLVRAGVKKFIIADYDTVTLAHLNRQNYGFDHIGMSKVDATESILLSVNPYLSIEKHVVKVTKENAVELFGKCDAVCEAMDISDEKSAFANMMVNKCPKVMIVSGSGMAGYGRSNSIKTKKSIKELYICGDRGDLEDRASIVLSPRANICAGHVANTIVALMMNGKV